jgi:O-acetyl-ADP-ribose deacetylase (regulator of RNase III)
MIELQRGNLLEADAEALVNTVNCVGVMGKGIALQFKQAYPENFREYERACRAAEVQVGRMFVHSTSELLNPRYIINFPTKRHWKGKSRLADIQVGLSALVEEVSRLGIRSIAVPPLGCGNGGLAWSEVRPLIERAFATLPDVKVFLFEPAGAPEANEIVVATKRPALTRTRALLIRILEQYGIPGYQLTMLEVQKLAYFLQASGESLRLTFVKHKYGPYAEALNHVLQRIEGHYLRGYGDRSREAAISPMPRASEEARVFLEGDAQAEERLERVSDLIFGFESPYGMELLATVHWIAQEDQAAAVDPDVAVQRVHEWSEHKRVTFRPEHIRTAWERLHQNGWLTVDKLEPAAHSN